LRFSFQITYFSAKLDQTNKVGALMTTTIKPRLQKKTPAQGRR